MCVRMRTLERGIGRRIYSPSDGFVHHFGTPLEDGGDDAGLEVCAYTGLHERVSMR